MSVSGKGARDKGANFEREIAKSWRDSGLFPDAKRGLEQTAGGERCPDITGTPFWVEAKRLKKVTREDVVKAFRQADIATTLIPDDNKPGRIVVYQQNRGARTVAMRLDVFMRWLGGDVSLSGLRGVSLWWHGDEAVFEVEIGLFNSMVHAARSRGFEV